MTINLNEGNQSPALVELAGGVTVGNGAGGPGTFAGDVITRVGSKLGIPASAISAATIPIMASWLSLTAVAR